MARIVIVGAGFSGHTAALYLRKGLRKQDELTVISASEDFVYHPLLADVASGRISEDKIVIPLKRIYERNGIEFIVGKVNSVFPDDNKLEYVAGNGSREKIDYDFLIIATGNNADFNATEGFVPDGETLGTLISLPEIKKTKRALDELIARMKRGEKKKIIVGSGHPQSTYHNASLNFAVNLHYRLLREKVRDKAEIVYFSNERKLGDFGLREPKVKRKGNSVPSEIFIKTILNESSIGYSVQNGVLEISDKTIFYENYEGEKKESEFDFAVLTPKTKGHGFKFVGADGSDISDKLLNEENYILVDTFYGMFYKEVFENPDYLPSLYRNRNYKNIFAGGFAFAMPSTVSEPHVTKNGLNITPAPMIGSTVSATIGRLIAKNIIQFLREERMTHAQRLSEMLSLFTVQLGGGKITGESFIAVVYPVFPDIRKYPKEDGRDLFVSELELGYAAHWTRKLIHESYLYKFKNRFGWRILPE